MPVTSTDFLSFAKDSADRNDEIGYRNAVGRAYYGAFHHVLSYMKAGPKDSHEGLKAYLHGDAWRLKSESYAKSDLIALGWMLSNMKGQRTISDYKLGTDVPKSSATDAISNCEAIIAKCLQI